MHVKLLLWHVCRWCVVILSMLWDQGLSSFSLSFFHLVYVMFPFPGNKNVAWEGWCTSLWCFDAGSGHEQNVYWDWKCKFKIPVPVTILQSKTRYCLNMTFAVLSLVATQRTGTWKMGCSFIFLLITSDSFQLALHFHKQCFPVKLCRSKDIKMCFCGVLVSFIAPNDRVWKK